MIILHFVFNVASCARQIQVTVVYFDLWTILDTGHKFTVNILLHLAWSGIQSGNPVFKVSHPCSRISAVDRDTINRVALSHQL